jgi:hypothetical protein
VESHFLLGCSHKIPNQASVTSKLSCHGIAAPSMASGLPRRNTVASNTILDPYSQGLSRHVLPHATPRFFAGHGHRSWCGSPNIASILLATRDGTSTPCSGGHTQDQSMYVLSSGVVMVFSLDFLSKGQGHPFIAVELSIGCHPSCIRRGNLRTMCGSRTGGWSLPCVMSD